MKKYEKSIPNRKALVEMLKELTGEASVYTFVPRCAYQVGRFFVEKDGVLTAEDGADETVIELLKEEGLIGAEILAPQPDAPVDTDTPLSVAEESDSPAETADDEPETDEDTDWVSDAEYEQEAAAESAVSLGVIDAAEEPVEEEAPADATAEVDVADEPLSEEETTAEPATADAAEETAQEEAFPVDADISFPMRQHTAASLTNLICMIYSRGDLLSKATGGSFHADKDLVDDLLDTCGFHRTEDVVSYVREWNEDHEGLVGLLFTEDKVTFNGFDSIPDADHLQTFMKLAAAMNKMAISQNRVQAKDVNADNEKYAFRIWLLRLGMNGEEYKADRKRLMKNLSGHTAFRTEAEAEKAKAKALRKRDALRALKAADAGGEAAGA